MKGPEGYTPSDPHLAEVSESPHISPEGHDVSTIEGATAYLLTLREEKGLPQPGGELDAATGYHLMMALQREDRAHTYENGRPQNVAEHTAKLVTACLMVASRERPDLNIGKVTIMAQLHDLIEAYCGDTVINDLEAVAEKPIKERAAMTLLRHELKDNSRLIDILTEYESQSSAEARFVKAMDKVEAYQFSLSTRARLHRDRWEDFPTVVRQALPKAVIDPTAFAMMQEALRHLGRKWEDWGCMPYVGDFDKIVEQFAEEALADYIYEQAVDRQQDTVLNYTGTSLAPEGLIQPEISAERAKQLGVTLLAERRLQSNEPNPPGPPPAAALVA